MPQPLTEAMAKLIELENKKAELKAFYEEYQEAANEVFAQIGIGSYFEGPDGTLYSMAVPTIYTVYHKPVELVRTRKEGESRGSISEKAAKEIRANGLILASGKVVESE